LLARIPRGNARWLLRSPAGVFPRDDQEFLPVLQSYLPSQSPAIGFHVLGLDR